MIGQPRRSKIVSDRTGFWIAAVDLAGAAGMTAAIFLKAWLKARWFIANAASPGGTSEHADKLTAFAVRVGTYVGAGERQGIP